VSLSPRGDWRMPSDADPAAWLRWVDEKNPGPRQLARDSTMNV
jgi:hypothetical protein